MTLGYPIVNFKELIDEEYLRAWNMEMRQFEEMDCAPVVAFETSLESGKLFTK